MKVNTPVERARFCSNAFWPTTVPGLFVPGPTYKALLKYGAYYTPTIVSDNKLNQYNRGKALGLLPLCNHIPLLNDIVQKTLYHTQNVKGKLVELKRREVLSHFATPKQYQESDQSVAFAARMYNLGTDVIQAVRDQIRQAEYNTFLGGWAMRLLVRAIIETEG